MNTKNKNLVDAALHPETEHELTDQELALRLAQRKQLRKQQCASEVQQALNNYNCRIEAVPFITPDGRIQVEIRIVSNE